LIIFPKISFQRFFIDLFRKTRKLEGLRLSGCFQAARTTADFPLQLKGSSLWRVESTSTRAFLDGASWIREAVI